MCGSGLPAAMIEAESLFRKKETPLAWDFKLDR
jgi:hypothetical protein